MNVQVNLNGMKDVEEAMSRARKCLNELDDAIRQVYHAVTLLGVEITQPQKTPANMTETDTAGFIQCVNAETPEENEITLPVHIDTSKMDRTTGKAERLNALLKEASSLVNELASKEIKLSVEVES